MTLSIELTEEIEEALRDEAKQQGTTPEQLVLKALQDRYAASSAMPGAGSAYDALKPFIARFNSRKQQLAGVPPSNDPQEKAFAAIIDEKYEKQGFSR